MDEPQMMTTTARSQAVGLCLVLLSSLSSLAIAAQPAIPKTLEDLKFRSVEQFEVSALPTGPVMGYRELSFKTKEFTYIPSDGIESGRYEWDAKKGDVIGTARSGKRYKGSYSPKTKILTWDGVKFKILPPAKDNEQPPKSPSAPK